MILSLTSEYKRLKTLMDKPEYQVHVHCPSPVQSSIKKSNFGLRAKTFLRSLSNGPVGPVGNPESNIPNLELTVLSLSTAGLVLFSKLCLSLGYLDLLQIKAKFTTRSRSSCSPPSTATTSACSRTARPGPGRPTPWRAAPALRRTSSSAGSYREQSDRSSK